MGASSGLYGKMFIHTISREKKILYNIISLFCNFLILVILILMSNCSDVVVHYRFYMFFFFFFCTDVIVQYMVLRCDRTFIGNDVIMPRICCTDVIVHWI